MHVVVDIRSFIRYGHYTVKGARPCRVRVDTKLQFLIFVNFWKQAGEPAISHVSMELTTVQCGGEFGKKISHFTQIEVGAIMGDGKPDGSRLAAMCIFIVLIIPLRCKMDAC